MSLSSKIQTLFWYLLRPSYYGQLRKLLLQKLHSDPKEDSRSESEKWCSERAIRTEDFLAKLNASYSRKLDQIFPKEFKWAHEQANNSPVKMGGPGNIELVYYISEHLQATRVIETGVAYGWTTLSLLLSMSKRAESKLISIDMPYAKMGNEDYVGCVVNPDLRKFWKLIRKPDQSALEPALSEMGTLDFCHYDSDKSYSGRMSG